MKKQQLLVCCWYCRPMQQQNLDGESHPAVGNSPNGIFGIDTAGFGPLFGAGITAALGRTAGTNGGMDLKTSPGMTCVFRMHYTLAISNQPLLLSEVMTVSCDRLKSRLGDVSSFKQLPLVFRELPHVLQGWACRRSSGRWCRWPLMAAAATARGRTCGS